MQSGIFLSVYRCLHSTQLKQMTLIFMSGKIAKVLKKVLDKTRNTMVSYGYDKVLMLCCLRHLILLFLTSFAIYLSRFCKSELYQDWHFFSPRSGFQYFVLHILLITFLRIKTLSRLVFQNKPLVITMTKGFSFYNIFKNDDRKSDVCKQVSLLLSLRFFSCKP